MKKLLALLLALVLCLGAMTVLAEDEVKFEPALEFMIGLSPVNGTSYVTATEKYTYYKSVYTTEGELLAVFPYTDIAYCDQQFFAVFNSDDPNARALVSVDGKQLTEAVYRDFTVFSDRWFAGLVLEPVAEGEEGNYKIGKEQFNIARRDLYFVDRNSGDARLVYTFKDNEFVSAAAHDDFIAVLNSAEEIKLYDSNFRACNYEMAKISSTIYGVKDFAVINLVSGDIVADGYVSLKEQFVNGKGYIIGTRYDYTGKKVSGVIDTDGNELMPAAYTVNTVANGYVVLTDESGLKGLYSVKEGRQILPCEFSAIMASKVSTDAYVHNGYVAVENGDLRGYYDIEAGELTCDYKYDKTKVTTVGCTTFWQTDEGEYTLAAADGVETDVYLDSIETKLTRGNGYLLVAKRDGKYGVIDWHGNVILPFEHSKAISITDDSKAIIRNGTGFELDLIVRVPQPAAAEPDVTEPDAE